MGFRWLSLFVFLVACGPDADQDGFHKFRDCDDNNPRAYPKLVEVCDGVDNDCDGYVDEDVSIVAYWDRDGDGFGDPERGRRVCAMPDDGVAEAGDCDDLNPSSHPDADEQCDEQDNDCDGEIDEEVQITYYIDQDGDGHGAGGSTTAACLPPEGYAVADDDCDDNQVLAWTGAPESCDGIDNNCDGNIDEDLSLKRQWADTDGDGYGDPLNPTLACGPGLGISDNSLDCDDADPSINPDAIDQANNNIDEDCDGYSDELGVPDNYPTIEDALAAASDGDVVQLDSGTFVNTVDLSGRDIIFAGEGCERTLLYGDGQGTTLTMDAGSVSSMSIAGGFAEAGGGLLIEGDVVAEHICLKGNSASDTGGGINVFSGELTLRNASLADNSAYDGGAIFVDFGASITIENSSFYGNTSTDDGAGINARGGDVAIYSSLFYDNTAGDEGGGVALQPHADPTTGEHFPSTGYVENATFVNNYAGDYGHSYHTREGSSTLINVLVADHVSDTVIATADGATHAISHLGVFNNNGHELREHYYPEAIRGLPRFIQDDPNLPSEDRDYHLLHSSPFIDAGDPNLLDPDGTRSDIGAYGGSMVGPDFNASYTNDSDSDGLLDGWEAHFGLEKWIDDGDADPDADNLSNLEESGYDSSPIESDTDLDGVSDGDEIAAGHSPTDRRDNAPIALIDQDKWAVVGDIVSVAGDYSRDPNLDPLTFQWSIAVPAGSAITNVDDPTAKIATFTPDAAGAYDLSLELSDGATASTAGMVVEVITGINVPNDEATIAEAIAASPFGGTIILEPGTYHENLNFNGKDIRIIGRGDAQQIVIDGGLADTVLTADAEEEITLVYLTLTGGYSLDGGAVHLANGSILNGHHLIIDSNSAQQHGGGIYAYRATVNIDNSVLSNNSAGSSGGALFGERLELELSHNRVIGNVAQTSGGGMYIWSSESRTWGTQNCTFAGNIAPDGAAIHQYGTNTNHYLTNNTFVDNKTDLSDDKGTYTLRSGDAVFLNNLFAYNESDPLISNNSGRIYPVYNNFWSNTGTIFDNSAQEEGGKRVEAPQPLLFIDDDDPTNDLWWLRPQSLLIDAGVPDHMETDGSVSDLGMSGGILADPMSRLALVDADADGMSDGWEVLFGLDLSFDDSLIDQDGDGLANHDEYLVGTRPDIKDTDLDGVGDAEEVVNGTNPIDPSDNRPVANAGEDLRVEADTLIVLDGSASSDPNGDTLSYSWTLLRIPQGSSHTAADISGLDTVSPSFTPDSRGWYELALVVSDDGAASQQDLVRIEAYGNLLVPGDYASLSDALADALNNDTIILDSGSYPVSIQNPGVSVTIKGAGVDDTSLEGLGGVPIFEVTGGEHIILEDLSLSGGNATTGGAVECSASSFTFRNVKLHHNAAYYGGAMSLSNCTTSLIDVELSDNASTGSGGALYINGGTFSWTRGKALRNESGSLGAGIYLAAGDYAIENVEFMHNFTPSTGAAVHQTGGNLELHHNTLVDNTDAYGAVFITGGQALITHNIFSGNTGYGLYISGAIQSGSVMSAEFNGYYDNAKGSVSPASYDVDSVHGDPWFVNYLAGQLSPDLRLQEGSPMVDAGNSACNDPDLSVCDLGAYSGSNAPSSFDQWYADTDGDGISDGWENNYGLDPNTDDAAEDEDGDGLSNLDEYINGCDPLSADTDSDGYSDNDEVNDGTDPSDPAQYRPTAEAGADQAVDIAVNVELDGGTSTDPNSDPLSYSWQFHSLPGRSSLTNSDLINSNSSLCSFTPDTAGTYVVNLVVDDGQASSSPDTVSIVVRGDLIVPDDYPSVHEAVEAIHSGYTIVIDAGTFVGSMDFMGKDISLEGSGRDTTLLSGGGIEPVIQAVSGENVVLRDLTITDGFGSRGGAVELFGNTLVTDNVLFLGNIAVYGGAIYADEALMSFTDTTFVSNIASKEGGGIYSSDGTLSATRLGAFDNEAYLYGGFLNITSTIVDIQNAILSDNWALQGGALRLSGTSTEYSEVLLDFTTATQNTSSSAGSAIRLGYGNAVVTNSILAFNGPQYAVSRSAATSSGYTQSYTLFHGNDPGTYSNILPTPTAGLDGNIDTDPSFIALSDDGDWTNDDWGLSGVSSATDAGDPNAANDPDGSSTDMGAFGGALGDWSP